MYNAYMSTMSIIVILFVFIYPKGSLTEKTYKNCNNLPSIGWYEKLQCYIPFYNSVIIRRSLYGYSGFIGIANAIFTVMLGVSLVMRLFLKNFSSHSPLIFVVLIVTALTLASMILMYAISMYIHWDMCNLFECRNLKILIILPQVCSFFLANKVDQHFYKNRDVLNETFG